MTMWKQTLGNWKVPHLTKAILKLRKNILRVGEWNVRTLYQAGKVENRMAEMQRMRIDILGHRWTHSGTKVFDDYTFVYSGGERHEHEVGLMVTKQMHVRIPAYL